MISIEKLPSTEGEVIDHVIERMLTDASIPFERLGSWQASKSFDFRFQERYLLEDGTRISIRGQDESVV